MDNSRTSDEGLPLSNTFLESIFLWCLERQTVKASRIHAQTGAQNDPHTVLAQNFHLTYPAFGLNRKFPVLYNILLTTTYFSGQRVRPRIYQWTSSFKIIQAHSPQTDKLSDGLHLFSVSTCHEKSRLQSPRRAMARPETVNCHCNECNIQQQ